MEDTENIKCKFSYPTFFRNSCLLCGSNASMINCDGIEGKKSCPFWSKKII